MKVTTFPMHEAQFKLKNNMVFVESFRATHIFKRPVKHALKCFKHASVKCNRKITVLTLNLS